MATLSVPIFNTEGKKIGEQQLNPAVFGVLLKDAVLHQAVTAQQANSRQVLAHTKGRGDVRGGGKKPWKQKGTGRARHGSIRSPLWSGGGVTFGPSKERNFAVKINKKVRQQALRMVLSDKVKNERLVVVEALTLETPKTKQLAHMLKNLPSYQKKTTLVTSKDDASVIQASKNIAKVHSLAVNSLNVIDLLKNEYMVVPKKLIATIEERYGNI